MWWRTLSRIPTLYGRLAYLTSLRDSNSGRYAHHGLALAFGEHQAHHALSKSHLETFREWLRMPVKHQRADLELYWSEQETQKASLLDNWQKLTPYRNLIPANASDAERALFLDDIESIIAAVKPEANDARPGRTGSRRRSPAPPHPHPPAA